MKRLAVLLTTILVANTLIFTGCTRTSRDDKNVNEMENGQVVEIEGQEDQYGWMPHLRLTFDGESLTEVYFDYVNQESAKKSQDEEYNSTMQEKTGRSAKEAMENLRANLLEVQDPTRVDIVSGATQTSEEFIAMAKQAFDNYYNGKTSANNYGEGNSGEQAQNEEKNTTGNKEQNLGQSTGSESAGTEGSSSSESAYTTGGDGNPNAQNAGATTGGATSEGGVNPPSGYSS